MSNASHRPSKTILEKPRGKTFRSLQSYFIGHFNTELSTNLLLGPLDVLGYISGTVALCV